MKKKTGFTLAEVLITLAIIGIIAALVIPAVMTNFQFRNIGIRLSKFMSTVENASRAYVVSDNALSSAPGDLTTYINSTFSLNDMNPLLRNPNGTGIVLSGNLVQNMVDNGDGTQSWDGTYVANDDPDHQNDAYIAAETNVNLGTFSGDINLGPLPRGQNLRAGEIVFKDGTHAILRPIQLAANYDEQALWRGQSNPGRDQVGAPVLGIAFDPLATAVPSTARRTFGFIITAQGYVFPAPQDDCLRRIINDNWVTRQETFSSGVCAQSNV